MAWTILRQLLKLCHDYEELRLTKRKEVNMKKYKGVYYLIKQNPRMYFWLAYIKLPKNHKWAKKKDYDDIPLDCHGGLTFMKTFTGKETKEENWWGFTKGTWIGWDYGHVGDFIDYGFTFSKGHTFIDTEKKWEYEEVEEEVKEVIKQL